MPNVCIPGIRLVVFDLDDTLYPERSFAFSGFETVGRWIQERIACPFEPARRMQELFETGHRGHVFDQLLAEIGHSDDQSMIQEMIVCYRNHQPRITLFTDAEEALNRWCKRFQTGLISDGPLAMQQNKVAALGLSERIDHMILTDQWGQAFWKPHPRAYIEMEKFFSLKPSTCIYIADNPTKDFLAPRKRGWQTIQIRRKGSIYAEIPSPEDGQAATTVESFNEIKLTS